MKTKSKIILAVLLLFLVIGTVSAVQYKNTADVTVQGNNLLIDNKVIANISEYNDTSFIEGIVADNAIIKAVGGNGANEVPSVSDYNLVYEFLTDNGFYYSFGKDGKYYVVTIDESQWHADMLKKMDNWCLENSK